MCVCIFPLNTKNLTKRFNANKSSGVYIGCGAPEPTCPDPTPTFSWHLLHARLKGADILTLKQKSLYWSPRNTPKEEGEVVVSPFLQIRNSNSFGKAWRMPEAQTTLWHLWQTQRLHTVPTALTLVVLRMAAVIQLSPELFTPPTFPPSCFVRLYPCHLTSWGPALSPRTL